MKRQDKWPLPLGRRSQIALFGNVKCLADVESAMCNVRHRNIAHRIFQCYHRPPPSQMIKVAICDGRAIASSQYRMEKSLVPPIHMSLHFLILRYAPLHHHFVCPAISHITFWPTAMRSHSYVVPYKIFMIPQRFCV